MREREQQLEASRDDWKAKNKVRYEEIKALKARLKESIENRDKWKAASNEQTKVLKEAEARLDAMSVVIETLKEELDKHKKKSKH